MKGNGKRTEEGVSSSGKINTRENEAILLVRSGVINRIRIQEQKIQQL